MRHFIAALPFMLLAGAAWAQTPPAHIGAPNVPAPWWMSQPVIASLGNVRAEVPANRAQFGASFQAVDKTAAQASSKAVAKVRELSRALAAYGADRAQIETTLLTRPLYDQYKNKEGQVLENQRSDKIDAYEVTASLTIRVRDVALLERIYAAVLGASPTSVSPVSFEFVPGNELLTQMQGEAIKNAVRRARSATEAAGARLNGIRVIDPTGRACQTDVLAGWPAYDSGGAGAEDVSDSVRSRMAPAPPPPAAPVEAPPPPGGAMSQDLQLTLQPPMRELADSACVVFAITG